MEYYFYIILIFAIILKLTLYLCWYQVRRNAAAREVRIIMPDGSTRYAVVTNASGVTRTRASSEERQCLPQADSLSVSVPYDNQGMVERPIQPRFMGTPQGMFPPYPGPNGHQWKLPKYEELENEPDRPSTFGEPPPYTPSAETSNSVGAQPPVVSNAAPSPATTVSASAIENMATPQVYSMAAAIPTIQAATGTTAPTYATSPTTSIHISAASALGRGPSPVVSPQTNTFLPQVGQSDGQTNPPN